MQYFDNNENLRSEIRKLNYKYDSYSFIFNSDLGVFSKDKIDDGSKLLAECYFRYGRRNVNLLDVGCGNSVYLRIIDDAFNYLSKDGKVALVGFGTYTAKKRAARDGINPLTKEKLHIPAKMAVSFKAGSKLKDALN